MDTNRRSLLVLASLTPLATTACDHLVSRASAAARSRSRPQREAKATRFSPYCAKTTRRCFDPRFGDAKQIELHYVDASLAIEQLADLAGKRGD